MKEETITGARATNYSHLKKWDQFPSTPLAAGGLEEHVRITLNYFSWYFALLFLW
jgi:hypothetical protein